ncbi:MAG: NADH-quinone oxidoreductase subunit C [Anaerolineaceae bacterium]|mgnify:CR=1 FL=1|nr:NADH-quinone oxidoreductase subunit C [Anaerolineaceae bacterium]
MTEIIDELSVLTGDLAPQKREDGYWFEAKTLNRSLLAKFMNEHAIRLSTMTAIERADGETDILYHFTNENVAINIRTKTAGQKIPSLGEFLPSANWIEREIHDLYAVYFEGHPDLSPLERPAELPEGFFRKEIADRLIKAKEAK